MQSCKHISIGEADATYRSVKKNVVHQRGLARHCLHIPRCLFAKDTNLVYEVSENAVAAWLVAFGAIDFLGCTNRNYAGFSDPNELAGHQGNPFEPSTLAPCTKLC